MGKIARQLIKSNFITDFTTHDANTINRTGGRVKFIWQVRNTGTWLYMYNEQDWAERLLERMNCYKSSGTCNIYYYYDKKKLVPLFENDVLSIAKKHFELRQKHILNNMSIKEVLEDAALELSDKDKHINPLVKENILIVKKRAEHLLISGFDESANYISSWEEYTGCIL
jgi:hypothetical protein